MNFTRSQQNGDQESSQPLLGSDRGVHDDRVLFSLDDDEEERIPSPPPKDTTPRTPNGRSVRFQDDVHVIGPPLRSTIQSRETGMLQICGSTPRRTNDDVEFEMDSDELDDRTLAQLQAQSRPRGRSSSLGSLDDQTMPLLVGLMDSSAARRSLDVPLAVNGDAASAEDGLEDSMKPTAGGSMIDSIANMANSILGAGEPAISSFMT